MKNRLRKLIFLKSFNNTRPIFILALFLLLITTFANFEFRKPKEARAGAYTFTENFSTTTYKDTANTTADWEFDTSSAHLPNGKWVHADNTNSPYLFEQIPDSYGSYMEVKAAVDNLGQPIVAFPAASGLAECFYFTKWSNAGESVCGSGIESCWTNLEGTVAGGRNNQVCLPVGVLTAADDSYKLLTFSDGLPAILVMGWAGVPAVYRLYYSQWSPSAGWTHLDGVTGGFEFINGAGKHIDQFAWKFLIDSYDEPVIYWGEYSDSAPYSAQLYFTRGVSGVWKYANRTTNGKEKIIDYVSASKVSINYVDLAFDSTGKIYFATTGPGSVRSFKFDGANYQNLLGTNLVLPITVLTITSLTLITPGGSPIFRLSSINELYVATSAGGVPSGRIYMAKWASGSWMYINGITSGFENIFPSSNSFLIDYNLDANDRPIISMYTHSIGFPPSEEIQFTRWNGSNWVKADGVTGGYEDMSSTYSSQSMEYSRHNCYDENNYPVFIYSDYTGGGYWLPVYFSRFTGEDLKGGDKTTNDQDMLVDTGQGLLNGQGDVYCDKTTKQIFAVIGNSAGGVYFTKLNNDLYSSTNGTLQSLDVYSGSPSENVISATLSASQTVSGGQSINYYLSNNGGSTWSAVTLDMPFTFLTYGNDLRWKAELSSSDDTSTPIIDDLTVSYQTQKKITCSLSPSTQDVGGAITVNASLIFTPVTGSVKAEFEQNNVNYANVTLSGGPSDYSGQLITDINHLGQNNVTVLATDSADGQIYTCNPSVGDVWVKKSLDDIAWEGRWGHQALSFNGKLWVLGGFNNYYSNEVWSSADGLSWTQVNASIPWVPRIEFRAAVFDNKMWVIGGQAIDPSVNPYLLNDVWSSSDGVNWVQETAAASWSARASFGLTVFNNELWVVGGCPTQIAGTCTSTDNQIWHSANGSSWTQMTTVGPMWTSRASFSLQSYNNSLWVIAGVQVPGPTYYNDVWSSPDGINWTQKTPAAAFSARSNFAGMPFNNGLTGEQMYIFGGGDSSAFKNDIYRSSDGITWNLVLDPADYPAAGALPSSWTNWTARKQLTVANFNNEMWVLGGREDNYVTRNDVWSSPDGVTWTLKGTNYGPPYGNRWDMPMVTFDTDGAGPTPAKLFLFGGIVKSPTYLANDVWTSIDGVNWTCLVGPYTYCLNPTPVPMWSARWGHKALVYNNKIWIIGGCQAMAGYTGLCSAGNRMRDVWSSSDGITWTQVLLNAPWVARYEPALTVYNNLMWFTGGYDAAGNTRPKDVYSSSNGVTWTLKTNTASWSGRMGHELLVYNDGTGEKMYLMGGFDGTNRVNDVWVSSDGITWTQKTASAAWNPRYTFGALNYNGQMFVFGGNNSIGVNWMRSNDVYSSTDGSTWTQLTNDTNIGSRDFFPSTIFNDRMWLAGGDGNLQTMDDIWASAYDFLHFNTINGGVNPLSIEGPSAPSNFYCEAISPDTIRWHFTDNATNETGFKLYGPNGLIKDSGPDIVQNLEYLDETNLSANTEYSQRYVTAFSGTGESGPSDTATCFSMANTPVPPGIREVSANSLLLIIDLSDKNPIGTEYAIKEGNSNEYLTADGKFSPDPVWQTYEEWGGSNGVIISGSPSINVKAEVHAALEPFTYYNFVVKARNGDGVETAFSGSTPILTAKTQDYPVISATKGVAINLVRNSASNLFKTAFAQISDVSESRYVTLLREFSFLLNIVLLILIVFLAISIFSSLKYLSGNSVNKKYLSLILSLFTKDPAYVFSLHAPRDEAGTFQSSYQKQRQMHLLAQKTLMRTLGLVLIKLIILAVLIFGLTSFNHSSSAQVFGYSQNGVQVNVGDTLNYIIEINNSGAISAGDIVINDLLDNNLAYVSGSAKAVTNSIRATIIESLVSQSLNLRLNIIPASSSARVTFDAIVRPGSEGSTISNQASIYGSNFTTISTNLVSNSVPSVAAKYSCNASTGSCSASTTGAYTSLAECQEDCVIPQPIRYSCNSTTGSCSASTTGNYSTLSDCQASCAIVPPPCVGEECIPQPPPCTGPECVQPPPCTGPECGPTPPPVCTGAECGIQPITPPSPIISSLGTTSIPIIDSVIQALNTSEALKIAKDYITPALLTIVAVNTIPAAILLTSYLLPYLHLIFIEPLLFLFRRKRKKWGVVYNALSKVPVDLAVVRLFSKTDNKLIQTRVTDRDGRYLMIIKEPGKYYISVTKAGFNFPTRYLSSDRQDSKYIDLYHGEAVEVTEKDAVITANIPLDPIEKKILPEREVIFGYIFKNLRIITAYFGLVLATLIFLIYPGWVTGMAIFVHALLFAIFQKLIVPPKPKSWGIIYDQKNKKPLHYAVVRIFDIKFNKLLETQVTDARGRYSFLVSKNEYQLLAEKQGYVKKEIKPIDLVEKEEIVNLDLGLEQKRS